MGSGALEPRMYSCSGYFLVQNIFENIHTSLLLHTLVNLVVVHSTAVRNLTKVWKTEKGPSQGGRAWSRGPESELFEILPYWVH